MKFKVSSKVKGSLILKSLGRAVSAGAVLHIEGHSLYADDTQRAIKLGLLEPNDPKEKIQIQEEVIDRTTEVVLINKTNRVVIIGDTPIRPNSSTIKDITQLDMNAVKNSVDKGLIQVIKDVDEELFITPTAQQEYSKKPPEEKRPESEVSINILEDSPSDPEEELTKLIEEADAEEEEEAVNSGVWDAKQQKMVKPQIVPKTGQRLLYDDEDEEDIDMIDALDEVNEVNEVDEEEIRLISEKIESMKKKLAKKTAKKKSAKKKSAKKKDNKVIKTKFTKESEEDIAQALDSMGNPLKNDMTHMVDGFNGNEVSFCDKE